MTIWNAPLVDQAPGVAALRGSLRHDEEAAVGEDALPEVLLLGGSQEQRQLFSQIRVQGVFPQPLDEGAERQDVGGFPDREALRDLVGVELAL